MSLVNLAPEIWSMICENLPLKSIISFYTAMANVETRENLVAGICGLKYLSLADIRAEELGFFLKNILLLLNNSDHYSCKFALIEEIYQIPVDGCSDKLVNLFARFAPRLKRITSDWVKKYPYSDGMIYIFAKMYAQRLANMNMPCLLEYIQFRDFSTGAASRAPGMGLSCQMSQKEILQLAPNFKLTWTVSGSAEVPEEYRARIHHLIILGEVDEALLEIDLSNLKELTLRCVPPSIKNKLFIKISRQITKISFLLSGEEDLKHYTLSSYPWDSLVSVKYTFSGNSSFDSIYLPDTISEVRILYKRKLTKDGFEFSLSLMKRNFLFRKLKYLHLSGFRYNDFHYTHQSGHLYVENYSRKSIMETVNMFSRVNKVTLTTPDPPTPKLIGGWKKEASLLEISLVVNQVPIYDP